MSFTSYFFGLLILLLALLMGRGLVTGAVGFGSAATRRAEDPTRYWFEIANCGLMILACAWLIASRGDVAADGFNPLVLIFVPQLLFSAVRALHRGHATLVDQTYARAEDPLLYWILVIGAFLVAIAITWLALPGSWT